MIKVKLCKGENCVNTFPSHYFHDYCSKHANRIDDAVAQEKCDKLFKAHGENSLIIRALNALIPNGEIS